VSVQATIGKTQIRKINQHSSQFRLAWHIHMHQKKKFPAEEEEDISQ
jgi:hypothetical protein